VGEIEMKKARHPREVIGAKKMMKCERTGTCVPEEATRYGARWFGGTKCKICKRPMPVSKVVT
jgi:hypothetical protein